MTIARYAWLPGLVLVLACGLVMGGGPPSDNGVKTDDPPSKAEKKARKAEKTAEVKSPGADAEQPATLKVKKEPFLVETTLNGVFEAETMTEVSINPDAWTMPLMVVKAVEHGTEVKQGDVLVELDLEKIDQEIADLKIERELTALALRQAEEELPVLEGLMPLELAAAERSKRQAEEDYDKFLKTDRPLAEESARFSVKSAQHWLESAKEELDQLQKMYRDKDLTEETEEMILKRQRFMVESAEFRLKMDEERSQTTLEIELPRREQRLREETEKQALELKKAQALTPLNINQKRLALNKLRYEQEKTADRLAKLERDREAMTIRAPADGIVYYGKREYGQWSTASAVRPKLQPGGVLTPSEVILTIVRPRPMFVRATVEEKDLHTLGTDLEGKATPTGYPDRKLSARLIELSAIPRTGGNFDAKVSVDLDDDAQRLMPGMACSVRFVSYRNPEALTVPASAVFRDDEDDEPYVLLAPEDDDEEPEKRFVQVGKTADGKTEILDGLEEGDEILASRP